MTDAIRPKDARPAIPETRAPATVSPPPAASGAVPQRPTSAFAAFWSGDALARRIQSTAADIGWLAKVPPPTTDVTAAFEGLNAQAKAGNRVLPANAADYVYLFTGGIFSNSFPQSIYLHENIEALTSQGCDARRVPIQTNQSVLTNAAVVRDAALRANRETGKRVIFIGHSKGGLDAGAAIALYPDVAAITSGLCTIQSPWGGSPVADDIAKNPVEKLVGSFVVRTMFGGDPAMGLDLQHSARKAFMAAHPLPAGLNVVSLATTSASALSSVAATGAYMRTVYGVPSDGLVVPSDAFIPGARTVRLSGLDHMDASPLDPPQPLHARHDHAEPRRPGTTRPLVTLGTERRAIDTDVCSPRQR